MSEKRPCKEISLAALALALLSLLLPRISHALTLDEAMALAEKNLPSYLAARQELHSSEELYKASLSPYLPSLDAGTRQEYLTGTLRDDYLGSYDVTLSYTLFDGGRRRAGRNIAGLNLDSSREELARSLLELKFDVKAAFYTAVARLDIVGERKTQLKYAEKDLEVARGRHRMGVAKLSDVLQASVRHEQARYNLVLGEGEYRNALADINSLIGKQLDETAPLQGSLDLEPRLPDMQTLRDLTLQRPEIRQAENAVDIARNNRKLELSAFYPVLTASTSYNRLEGRAISIAPQEETSVGLRVTWNIFELGKFYRTKASEFQINASEENLNETLRLVLLNLSKAREDYVTASRNISVAQEQLRQAEQNYSQAFGEYSVGKSDILSLVQAESFLATAREQLVRSRLGLMLSKALLERATGIDNLETLVP